MPLMAAGTNPAYLRKPPGAVRTLYVDFGDYEEIRAGDELTGTPTVTEGTAGVTLSNKVVATSVTKRGRAVPGQYVTFTASGGSTTGGAGSDGVYSLTVTVSTTGGATLQCHPELRVENV
jgi:hypothetical protein